MSRWVVIRRGIFGKLSYVVIANSRSLAIQALANYISIEIYNVSDEIRTNWAADHINYIPKSNYNASMIKRLNKKINRMDRGNRSVKWFGVKYTLVAKEDGM